MPDVLIALPAAGIWALAILGLYWLGRVLEHRVITSISLAYPTRLKMNYLRRRMGVARRRRELGDGFVPGPEIARRIASDLGRVTADLDRQIQGHLTHRGALNVVLGAKDVRESVKRAAEALTMLDADRALFEALSKDEFSARGVLNLVANPQLRPALTAFETFTVLLEVARFGSAPHSQMLALYHLPKYVTNEQELAALTQAVSALPAERVAAGEKALEVARNNLHLATADAV